MTACNFDLCSLIHSHSPSSSLTLSHPPSPSLILPHPSSSTLTPSHPPSPLIHLHPPSSSLTLSHPPSPFLIHPHPPSSTLTLPHPPSPSFILPHFSETLDLQILYKPMSSPRSNGQNVLHVQKHCMHHMVPDHKQSKYALYHAQTAVNGIQFPPHHMLKLPSIVLLAAWTIRSRV